LVMRASTAGLLEVLRTVRSSAGEEKPLQKFLWIKTHPEPQRKPATCWSSPARSAGAYRAREQALMLCQQMHLGLRFSPLVLYTRTNSKISKACAVYRSRAAWEAPKSHFVNGARHQTLTISASFCPSSSAGAIARKTPIIANPWGMKMKNRYM